MLDPRTAREVTGQVAAVTRFLRPQLSLATQACRLRPRLKLLQCDILSSLQIFTLFNIFSISNALRNANVYHMPCTRYPRLAWRCYTSNGFCFSNTRNGVAWWRRKNLTTSFLLRTQTPRQHTLMAWHVDLVLHANPARHAMSLRGSVSMKDRTPWLRPAQMFLVLLLPGTCSAGAPIRAETSVSFAIAKRRP